MSSLASDWQLRVSLCGDANVGKTSLFLRFSKEDECTEREITHETKKERTVGSDDSTKSFLVGRKSLRVTLHDTAGQELHQRSLTGSVYRRAQAILFVCAVDDDESLISLSNWLRDAKNYNSDARYYVIANKIDLQASDEEDESFISDQMLDDFVETHHSDYPICRVFRTSALKNTNVKEMFDTIVTELADAAVPKAISLPIDINTKQGKCCN